MVSKFWSFKTVGTITTIYHWAPVETQWTHTAQHNKIQKPSAMVDTIPHIYHSSRKQNSISIHHNISNTNKNTAVCTVQCRVAPDRQCVMTAMEWLIEISTNYTWLHWPALHCQYTRHRDISQYWSSVTWTLLLQTNLRELWFFTITEKAPILVYMKLDCQHANTRFIRDVQVG